MRRRLFLVFLIGLLSFPTGAVWAQGNEPPNESQTATHVVMSGETLYSIAKRYNIDLRELVRLNGLSDPREIYVGQHLKLHSGPVDVSTWQQHAMQLGEDLSLLACYDGYDVDTVAKVNGLLNPVSTLPGMSVLLPGIQRPASLSVVGRDTTPLELAFRYDQPLWDVLRHNPHPFYAGECVRLSGATSSAEDLLPYPLEAVHLSKQPIERGKTTVLELVTEAPVTCQVTYLDQTTYCFSQDERTVYALLSFSPLLEPDTYDVQVRVRYDESEIALTLPLVVSPGRFGFERIDLPPSRQSLFDPELLNSESALVNRMAATHTAQRYWQTPFAYPVQSSVSSYFGARRSYGGSYNSYHSGVDFRASTGVAVQTPSAGTVVMAEPLTVRGNAIIIDHGWGVLTGYWHLSKIDVEVGQYVSQGQVIGRVGNTGLSTGSHLHWQLWVDGKPVDPLQWAEMFHTFPDPTAPVTRSAE